MLNAMRDGAKSGILRYILFGFMGLAVGGLVLTDVGGFFRGGISASNVAEGKGLTITANEFDQTVRRALAGQSISPQQAYQMGYINMILSNEIQMRLFSREAERIGLLVSDERVKAQIADIAEPLAQGGQDKGSALRQVLRARGISEDQFILSVRQEMANTALQNAIAANGAVMPDVFLNALYESGHQKRDVKAFELKNSSITDLDTPTQEQLLAFYEANKMDYANPERRSFTLAILNAEMVTDTIEITEDDLQAAYETNIAAYSKPERRKLQQAILSTPELAQRVANRVTNGTSLQRAVRNVTGDDAAYTGEEDFQQSGLLEEIADPVFGASKGDMVGPVQTALGWHVMVVTDILDPEVEPLSKVRGELEKALMQERSFETLLDTANMIDDQLAGGGALEELVSEFGLTTQKISNVTLDGSNPAGKDALESYGSDAAQILEMGFDYLTGESAPVLETQDGQFIVVRVDEIIPLTHDTFEDVKSALEKRYMDEQRRAMNRARAQAALQSILSGQSIEEVAKSYNARIRSFKNLEQDQDAPEMIGPLTLGRLFTQGQGGAALGETDDGIVIAQNDRIQFEPADTVKDSDISAFAENLRNESTTSLLQAYMDILLREADIRTNERLLVQTYGTEM